MKGFSSHRWSSLFAIVVLASPVIAKDWHGIVPLKSNRTDVKRLFGVAKKSSTSASYYTLPSAIVVFRFQTESCDSEVGRFGLGWSVPSGTVVGIGIIPKGAHRREEYHLAKDAKVDDNGAGFIYYSDYVAGLSVETYKNLATLVDYYPGASEDHLRCPQIQECCIDFFPRFDEYQSLIFEDEKARLDNFVIQITEMLGRGVLEVLGPSKTIREQQMKHAARLKEYLLKKRLLERERLLVVDGGFKESSLTRLSLYSIGGLPGLIHLFPEKDPENAAPNKRLERTRR